jgi:hypothetical protein
MATLVKFLVHPEHYGVFAYFPQLNYAKNFYGNKMKCSYCHIGQHSSCSVEYAQECRKATFEEYKDLYDELIYMGYRNLKICK